MKYLSVCSGMEAASVAWEPLGWKPVGFSEIEPFPCAILKHRFPNTPNYGSLTEYQSWPLEPDSIDLLVGGTPCQSFSVAGLRKGLTDPRGNLALTFLGLADKLKPRWIIWENVPGVLSSGGGRDFGSFLGALVELGYGFAYRVLDAQHFGVPQRRRRVFVVACRNPITGLGDWRAAAEVLSIDEGLRGHLEAGGKKRKSVAPDAGSGVEAGRKWPADLACTLNASFGDKQGLEDQHALGGGSLFVPADTIGTLCARDYKGVGNQYVQEGKCIPCEAPRQLHNTTAYIMDSFTSNSMLSDNPNSGCREVDMTKCLDTSCLNPACHQGGVMITQSVGQPIAIQGTIIDRSENAGPQGVGATEGGPMFTLTKADIHGVATPKAVRRLTPNECYRLQGFPDNWGRIPWKGKPAEECPDGPQYKACGNSMAVPVMFWIGERINNYGNKI